MLKGIAEWIDDDDDDDAEGYSPCGMVLLK